MYIDDILNATLLAVGIIYVKLTHLFELRIHRIMYLVVSPWCSQVI